MVVCKMTHDDCMVNMKKAVCILLATVSVVALAGCSGSLVNLTYQDGKMINKRLQLAYTPAPTCYEPVSVGAAYGYYGDMDMTLYEIVGTDPKQWLTQEYAGGATTIFYADGITLPTLAEMAPEKIHVCQSENITYGIATVDNPDVVTKLTDLFVNGEAVDWPMVDALEDYELKFVSSAYPHFYYNLTYYEYADGIYLYDRNSKRCVEIGDMLEEWVENHWEE